MSCTTSPRHHSARCCSGCAPRRRGGGGCCYGAVMAARGGVLLLRVGDAGAGLRFHFTQWVDQAVMLTRGQGLVALHCRSIEQWRGLLGECGFHSRAEPMSHGTPFANVLLIALAI